LHFLEGVKAASFLHFINRIFMKNELSPGLLSRYRDLIVDDDFGDFTICPQRFVC